MKYNQELTPEEQHKGKVYTCLNKRCPNYYVSKVIRKRLENQDE